MRKLTIDVDGTGIVVDEPARSGTPFVGRGASVKEALGDYFMQNHKELGFDIDMWSARRKPRS